MSFGLELLLNFGRRRAEEVAGGVLVDPFAAAMAIKLSQGLGADDGTAGGVATGVCDVDGGCEGGCPRPDAVNTGGP